MQIWTKDSFPSGIYKIEATVCVHVCVFSLGGHSVGPTVLKFGMEDHTLGIHFALVPLSQEAKEWFWRSMQPKRCISVKIS